MRNRKLNAAKKFMLSWMSPRRTYKPVDFDEIVGGGYSLSTGMPNYNRSIFFNALGELVKEKKVHYWRIKDGCHCYRINDGHTPCPKSTFKEVVVIDNRTPEEKEEARKNIIQEVDTALANYKNALASCPPISSIKSLNPERSVATAAQ